MAQNETTFGSINHVLGLKIPAEKVKQAQSLYQNLLETEFILEAGTGVIPNEAGFPVGLEWVPPKQLKSRGIGSEQGRCAMLHAIAHIEFNAINLALDAICRFQDMPQQYYIDWLRVAAEESYHFHLLSEYLSSYGYVYSDFPVHNGLWNMAQETEYDVLARMACVPRLMEARGLDVAPIIANKLKKASDKVGAQILNIIFHDEKSHVEVGNRWFHYLCQTRGLNPIETFKQLVSRHAPEFLKGPYNTRARLEAGFNQDEIDWIESVG